MSERRGFEYRAGIPRIAPVLGLFAAVALLAPDLPAHSEDRPGPVIVPSSEVHLLDSKRVGDTFRIDVALPYSYAEETDRSYPVVYTLDADMMFASVADIVRMAAFGDELPEVIVVGQGYPRPSVARVGVLRARDYTPTVDDAMNKWMASRDPELAEHTSTGGASRFLAFLQRELIPFVERRYRTTGPRVFVGDSFGGLFGLHALFESPATFDRWLIGSPSIWYGEEITLSAEEEFARSHQDLDERVFFSVGSLEELPGVPASQTSRMVSNTRKLHHRLKERGYPSLRTELVIFDDETHLSVVPAAISRGLRWLLRE